MNYLFNKGLIFELLSNTSPEFARISRKTKVTNGFISTLKLPLHELTILFAAVFFSGKQISLFYEKYEGTHIKIL